MFGENHRRDFVLLKLQLAKGGKPKHYPLRTTERIFLVIFQLFGLQIKGLVEGIEQRLPAFQARFAPGRLYGFLYFEIGRSWHACGLSCSALLIQITIFAFFISMVFSPSW